MAILNRIRENHSSPQYEDNPPKKPFSKISGLFRSTSRKSIAALSLISAVACTNDPENTNKAAQKYEQKEASLEPEQLIVQNLKITPVIKGPMEISRLDTNNDGVLTMEDGQRIAIFLEDQNSNYKLKFTFAELGYSDEEVKNNLNDPSYLTSKKQTIFVDTEYPELTDISFFTIDPVTRTAYFLSDAIGAPNLKAKINYFNNQITFGPVELLFDEEVYGDMNYIGNASVNGNIDTKMLSAIYDNIDIRNLETGQISPTNIPAVCTMAESFRISGEQYWLIAKYNADGKNCHWFVSNDLDYNAPMTELVFELDESMPFTAEQIDGFMVVSSVRIETLDNGEKLFTASMINKFTSELFSLNGLIAAPSSVVCGNDICEDGETEANCLADCFTVTPDVLEPDAGGTDITDQDAGNTDTNDINAAPDITEDTVNPDANNDIISVEDANPDTQNPEDTTNPNDTNDTSTNDTTDTSTEPDTSDITNPDTETDTTEPDADAGADADTGNPAPDTQGADIQVDTKNPKTCGDGTCNPIEGETASTCRADCVDTDLNSVCEQLITDGTLKIQKIEGEGQCLIFDCENGTDKSPITAIFEGFEGNCRIEASIKDHPVTFSMVDGSQVTIEIPYPNNPSNTDTATAKNIIGIVTVEKHGDENIIKVELEQIIPDSGGYTQLDVISLVGTRLITETKAELLSNGVLANLKLPEGKVKVEKTLKDPQGNTIGVIAIIYMSTGESLELEAWDFIPDTPDNFDDINTETDAGTAEEDATKLGSIGGDTANQVEEALNNPDGGCNAPKTGANLPGAILVAVMLLAAIRPKRKK